jgi:hypothetical protein
VKRQATATAALGYVSECWSLQLLPVEIEGKSKLQVAQAMQVNIHAIDWKTVYGFSFGLY